MMTLVNRFSVKTNPDEMPCRVPSHLDQHCLQMSYLWDARQERDKGTIPSKRTNSHSKIDRTKILMTDGSLMKV